MSPAGLRTLLRLWTANLDDGLGSAGDDRVFKRSFSALSLSVIAAADLSAPFLEPREVNAFFDRVLDYFQRERDLRGFDPVHGWMHTVAHTSDTLKFLARNPRLAAGGDVRLLAAVRAKLESHDAVFTWGENDRMALALHSAVRRPDADTAALSAWTQAWVQGASGSLGTRASGGSAPVRRDRERQAGDAQPARRAVDRDGADRYGRGGAAGAAGGAGEDAVDACSGGTRAAHGIASSSADASCSTTCSCAWPAAELHADRQTAGMHRQRQRDRRHPEHVVRQRELARAAEDLLGEILNRPRPSGRDCRCPTAPPRAPSSGTARRRAA